jgi:hypothetical protein
METIMSSQRKNAHNSFHTTKKQLAYEKKDTHLLLSEKLLPVNRPGRNYND